MNSAQKTIHQIDRLLTVIEKSLLAISLGLSLSLMLLQIILRYFFHSGLLWIDPLTRYLILWFCLFGTSLGLRNDRFIGMEVVTKFLNPYWKRISYILTYGVTILIVFFMAKASMNFLAMEKEYSTTFILNWQNWYFILVLPIGFAFIGLRLFLRIINLLTTSHYEETGVPAP